MALGLFKAWTSLLVDDVGRTDGSAALVVTASTDAPVSTRERGPDTTTGVALLSTGTTGRILLASNPARRGAIIRNTGMEDAYVSYGSVVATTARHAAVVRGGTEYLIPFGFTGAVTGVVSAGSITLAVTEFS